SGNVRGLRMAGRGWGTGIKSAAECGCGARQIVIQHGQISNFARAIDLQVIGGSPTTYVLDDLRIAENSEFGARLGGESIVRNSVFYGNGACPFLDSSLCPPLTEPRDGLTVSSNSIVPGNVPVP